MISAFWSEFRNGAPLAVGVLTTVLGVALALSVGSQSMLPGCADPLNVGLILGVTASPIALGAAIVHLGMHQTSGLAHVARTTPRGRRGSLLLAWSAIAAWQLVAYALTQLALFASTSTDGYCSASMLVLPLAGLTFAVLVSGIGIALGARYPHWVAGVMSAAAAFIAVMALQRADGPAEAFAPTFIRTYYQPFFEPNVSLNVLHAATYAAAIASIALVLGARSALRTAGAACATAAAVAALVATGVHGPDPVQYRADDGSRICATEHGVTLCVWPESEALLEDGLDALVRARASIDDYFDAPTVFLQEGLETSDADDAIVRFDARSTDPTMFSSTAIRALVPEPSCAAGLEPWFEVIDWINAGTDPQFVAGEIAAIRQLPIDEQRRWVTERLGEATTACR